MALAWMCSAVAGRSLFGHRLHFSAFVVDHRARTGSTEEALRVCRRLEAMSQCPKLTNSLTKQQDLPHEMLSLSRETEPFARSGFETRARRNRYQVLGSACAREGVNNLLTGHHNDDQAETILLRILRGVSSAEYVGMKRRANIPECHGLYGVAESGSPCQIGVSDMMVEAGGVKVGRPLLQLSKSDLREICVRQGIEWEEDRTNVDATLTPRNAIRKLLQGDRLPRALRKDSLLALWCRAEHMLLSSNFDWNGVHTHFSAELGCVLAKFPSRRRQDVLLILGCAVTSLTQPVGKVWARTDWNRTAFTANGVLFRHLAPNDKLCHFPEAASGEAWLISREPPRTCLSTQLTVHENLDMFSDGGGWSSWHLWDGRYWIRVKGNSKQQYWVRHFQASDTAYLKKIFNSKKSVGPPKILQTMPVIIGLCAGDLQPLAFPSLRPRRTLVPLLDSSVQREHAKLDWQINYRHITCLSRSSMPGVT